MACMINDIIYFGGYYRYMDNRLVRLSRNANSVDQAGDRRAEPQHIGIQMMDSAMVPVSVHASLVYKEFCAQVCRFRGWAYDYTVRCSLLLLQ
jgi:hypothetical protein